MPKEKNEMSEKKDKPIDLFKEGALQKAIEKSIEPAVNSESLKDAIVQRSVSMQEAGTTQWDVLKGMMEGEFAERAIQELRAMPGKDFLRNYLKVLEHFKPKLTRQDEGEVEKPDLTINIQTMIINPQTGEQEVVDITDLQNYTEEENNES